MGTRKHTVPADRLSAKDPALRLIVGGKPMAYEEAYDAIDFQDDDTPNWRAVKSLQNSSVSPRPFKIAAGTAMPKNIDMTGDLAILGARPSIILAVPATGDITGTKLQVFNDMYPVYNYTDNNFNVLSSIDIFGHDDGTGKFAEDTYVIMKK